MSSLASLAPTASFTNYYKLVGIWDGLSVGFSSSYPTSGLLSLPQVRIFQVYLQEASLVGSSIVVNLGGSDLFWYITISLGDRFIMELSLMGAEGYDRE